MYNKLIDMFKTFISINEEEKHLISNLFREKHYKKDEWFISGIHPANYIFPD